VLKTSVSNIGSGDSNSDDMVLLALDSSALNVTVDEYSYLNPDGDGRADAATGLEVAFYLVLVPPSWER